MYLGHLTVFFPVYYVRYSPCPKLSPDLLNVTFFLSWQWQLAPGSVQTMYKSNVGFLPETWMPAEYNLFGKLYQVYKIWWTTHLRFHTPRRKYFLPTKFSNCVTWSYSSKSLKPTQRANKVQLAAAHSMLQRSWFHFRTQNQTLWNTQNAVYYTGSFSS